MPLFSQRHQRLIARRSSTCAPDPWNKAFADDVQSTSILTIVKLINPTQQTQDQKPSSPQRGRSFRGSGRSRNDSSTQKEEKKDESNAQRMTFAFNAFQPTQAGSPPSSPRLRPSSPHRNLSNRSVPQPRLGPDQLYDLAKTSIHNSQLPQKEQTPAFQPATFTPLPENIYLPFIDRPAEVTSLISSHPSIKLFSLLSQTFPADQSKEPITDTSLIPSNPKEWTFAHLHAHLTIPDRAEIPDDIWVLKARKAILEHSELIWERVKGALGVPPELDVDVDLEAVYLAMQAAEEIPPIPIQVEKPQAPPSPLPPPPSSPPKARRTHRFSTSSAISVSSIDTEAISDDEGQPARGHWDDWDAVMDSPLWARPKSRLAQSRAQSEYGAGEEPLGIESYGDYGLEDELGLARPPSPGSLLSIEPLLPNSTAAGLGSPNMTNPGAGLDDIQEGAEEEEGADDTGKEEKEDDGLISPQSIQGLRISTSPAYHAMSPASLHASLPPSFGSVISPSSGQNTQGVPSPISPLPPYFPGYGVAPGGGGGPGGGVSPSLASAIAGNPFFPPTSTTPPSHSSPTIPSASAQPTSTSTSIPIAGKQRTSSVSFDPASFRRSGSFGSLGSLRDLGNFPGSNLGSNLSNLGSIGGGGGGESISFSGSERSFIGGGGGGGYASGGEGRGPRFPSSFAQAKRRAAVARGLKAAQAAQAAARGDGPLLMIGRKPRTMSHSSIVGGGGSHLNTSTSLTAIMTSSLSSSTSIPLSSSAQVDSPMSMVSPTSVPVSGGVGVGVGVVVPRATPALGGSVSGYKRLSWGVPVVIGGVQVQREGGESEGEGEEAREGGKGEEVEKEGEEGEGEKTAVGSPAG